MIFYLFTGDRVINVDESDRPTAIYVWWSPIVGSFLQYELTYLSPDGIEFGQEFVPVRDDPRVYLEYLTPGQTYRLVLRTVFSDGSRVIEGETTYTLSK